MTTNPQGYKPKNPRKKYPLTIEQQRKLIDRAEGKTKAILLFFLSTGAHPSVLTDEDKEYRLDLTDDNYYSWNRPKTHREVQGRYPKCLQDKELRKTLNSKHTKGKDPTRYWQIIKKLGEDVGIKGVCPVQLRHTYFVNRGRLGHHIWDIAHGAATSVETISQYYTIGMGESKKLSKEDRGFLEWLMEV